MVNYLGKQKIKKEKNEKEELKEGRTNQRRDTGTTGTRIKMREGERAKRRGKGRDIAFSPCSNLEAFRSTREGIRGFHCL